MAPGFQVQLVASEPLVEDPIVAEFDGDGRLWVIEMKGYAVGKAMVNMTEPVGDIAILEDTDGDGVYDKRTVFLDKLVLPRALKILDHNCALVGEPPNLVKACDTNGDLKADTKEVVKDGFGRVGNIEHSANALYWSMDNTINVSEHNYNVLPKGDGKFETVPNLSRGQWGVTQNDGGIVFRNFNTDPLFADYVPAHYYVRNPDLTRTSGLYENLVDQAKSAVWPVQAHPGRQSRLPPRSAAARWFGLLLSGRLLAHDLSRQCPAQAVLWPGLCGRQPHQSGPRAQAPGRCRRQLRGQRLLAQGRVPGRDR